MGSVKKGLSYVLGDTSANENHILPINAMQYSRTRGILLTGGRDGVVKSWSASGSPANANFVANSSKDSPNPMADIDERLLKLETAISSNSLPCKPSFTSYTASTIRNYNVHFDWINDVKLVNQDRHVATALADLSIKLIDLDSEDGDVHKFADWHTDYIKKISPNSAQGRLISGGLDGNIVMWDLATLRPIQHFANHASGANGAVNSVYSLSNNLAHLVAAGGPNNAINIYDTRLTADGRANLVRVLVGHQDNVRCLLMNSLHVLSGLSDTTVKLWDLRNYKVLRNFELHDDAVWSLATKDDSTDFSTFFSGDKAGHIVKTDLSYLHSLGRNLAAFGNADLAAIFNEAELDVLDEKIGISTTIARTTSPVVALCVEGDDDSLFASTYTALERYHVPDTSGVAEYQYLRCSVDFAAVLEGQLNEDGMLEGSVAENSELDSDFFDIVSHLSMDTGNDLQSTFSAFKAALPGLDGDGCDGTLPDDVYRSIFLSTEDGVSSMFVNAYKDGIGGPGVAMPEEGPVDKTPVEILLSPVSPSLIIPIPYNKLPFLLVQVSPKAIVAKKMFNNKRWMLTLYLNGEIKIWDVFICREIKSFPHSDNGQGPLTAEGLVERLKEMDRLFQKFDTMDTLSNWCEVEIRLGRLLVTIRDSIINNVEIYYDDLVKEYPFLAYDHSSSLVPKSSKVTATADDRFIVAKILINSFFQQYSRFEYDQDRRVRERFSSRANTQASYDSERVSLASVEESSPRKKLFSRKSSRATSATSKVLQSSAASTSSLKSAEEASVASSVAPDDSISRMLEQAASAYSDKTAAIGSRRSLDTLYTLYTNELNYCSTKNDPETYKPLIPFSELPGNLLVIVFETSPELGNYRDVFSFHLEDLNGLGSGLVQPSPAKTHLIELLRNNLPKWVGLAILFDKFPTKEPPKIAFQLQECDYSTLPLDKKIGGKVQRKIKKLPSLESSIKLTSQSMLRVNKILVYLTEKFELRTTEMKDKKQPRSWLVLECKGRELDPNMTLQTIKTKIWKSSTDIELKFRRKFDS